MTTEFQRTGDEATDAVLRVIVSGVKALEAKPANQSVLLEGVPIGTTDTRVQHGLGRTPRAWRVVDQNADATIWRTSPFASRSFNLRASAPVVVSL